MGEYTVGGRRVQLDHDSVVRRLREVRPEPIAVHAVEIGGRLFPVVQALEVASGVPRSATRSARARQILRSLGFRPSAKDASTLRRDTSPDENTPELEQFVDDALQSLREPRAALAAVVRGDSKVQLDGFGLYAIYAGGSSWAELGLRPFDHRPLYVGKAESGTLMTRDLRTHVASGRTGSSTVRRSFAALLRHQLELHGQPRNVSRPERFANFGLSPEDDEKLTAWMIRHLQLATWIAPFAAPIASVERSVLHRLLPALNIADCPGPWRAFVSAERAVLAEEARRWTPQGNG